MQVLIVGAGPAGLTTAVELARRGVVADVIDLRASGSGLSRAVGIMPASLEILAPSGVAEKLLGEGMKYRHVRFYFDGSLALALPFEVTGAGAEFILGLAQDRTETHMRDVLSGLGGAVRYGTALVGLQQDADKVTITTGDGVFMDQAGASMSMPASTRRREWHMGVRTSNDKVHRWLSRRWKNDTSLIRKCTQPCAVPGLKS